MWKTPDCSFLIRSKLHYFVFYSCWGFSLCLIFLLLLHTGIWPTTTRWAPWEHHFDSTTPLWSCLMCPLVCSGKGSFLFWFQALFCLVLRCFCCNTCSAWLLNPFFSSHPLHNPSHVHWPLQSTYCVPGILTYVVWHSTVGTGRRGSGLRGLK